MDFYVSFMSSHDQKQSKLSGALQDSAKAHGGLYCIGMHGLNKFCFYNVIVVALK